MQITLKRAEAKDLEAITVLFKNTIDGVCHKDYNEVERRVWKNAIDDKVRWAKKIEDQYFVLAYCDDQLCGMASLEKGQTIDVMYSHHQYQRRGIAQFLLDHLEEKAGAVSSHLNADVSITARPFFLKNGFVQIRENRILRDSVVLINYRLEKKLNGGKI